MDKKFTIVIETGWNAAFEDGQEVQRILREIADRMDAGDTPRKLRDINGNMVGTVTVE